MNVVAWHFQLVEICACRLGRNARVSERCNRRARGTLRELAAVLTENQPVVDELRRRRTKRLEHAPLQRFVRPVVVAAHDVRDAEVDVVDDRRELVRRRAVLAQESDAFEPVPERRSHLAVPLRPVALPHGPLVPGDPEPFQVLQDRVLPTRNVPRRIGVVDPKEHPLAQVPIRDRAERVAEMERPRRTRREADSGHLASV